MRVFLDTNVLVSAFATRGICGDIVRLTLAEHQLVLGETVLAELASVLTKKMRVPPAIVREIEELLRREAVVMPRGEPLEVDLRDEDDRAVLGEALEGRASVLVTGDQELVNARERLPLHVTSPRGFWETIRRESQ